MNDSNKIQSVGCGDHPKYAGNACAPQREPEVRSQANMLRVNLERISALRDELADRLRSIMVERDPEPYADVDSAPTRTRFGSELQDMNFMAAMVGDSLQKIISDLEV